MNETSCCTVRYAVAMAAFAATLAFPSTQLAAQTSVSSTDSAEASLTLPDAPGLSLTNSSSASPFLYPQNSSVSQKLGAPPTGTTLPEASRTEKYIEPGQSAPSLTVGNKALLGLKDAFSPFAAVGWLASAGYEQALNGSPNYGTDRGAFGQRLGAAALRDSSEGVFSDSIMSPLLREDPRYYRMGPGHNFFVRAVYAATRPIITRTDGGRTSPNLALLSGTLAGSALTQAYYPQINRGATQVMETFGGSLGGSAVGDVVSEFLEDVTGMFHKHN